MSKETFEKIYEKPKEVVWTKTEPPKKLRELIENKTILPCKAIDIACGEGNYSLYLASKPSPAPSRVRTVKLCSDKLSSRSRRH